MDLSNQLRYMLLIGYLLEISTCPSADHCHRQTFYEIPNKSYTGEILVREGPWPLHKCRRLCRQYLECEMFSMEWLNDKFGMCSIYNGLRRPIRLRTKNQSTIYMTTSIYPKGFQWHENVNKFYSTEVYKEISGAHIVMKCKELHPDATPVEPRNQAQMEIIAKMATGVRRVWLGIYRPRTSNKTEHLVYYSDGTSITYSYWRQGDPNNVKNSEDCVAAVAKDNFTWVDCNCNKPFSVICEL